MEVKWVGSKLQDWINESLFYDQQTWTFKKTKLDSMKMWIIYKHTKAFLWFRSQATSADTLIMSIFCYIKTVGWIYGSMWLFFFSVRTSERVLFTLLQYATLIRFDLHTHTHTSLSVPSVRACPHFQCKDSWRSRLWARNQNRSNKSSYFNRLLATWECHPFNSVTPRPLPKAW